MDDVRRVEDGRGYFLEELAVGMSASFGKTVTDADVLLFAGVSGDTNPVHLNEDYAQQTRFGGRITHGLLSAGLISAVLGTKLPGPGSIYVSQNLRFKAPVRAGDTVVARVTVTEIVTAKSRVILRTQCTVADNVVIDGEATIMVPRRT
ncbi:MAG: MaoC family dehydratase [Inquilinaceae bacterium]